MRVAPGAASPQGTLGKRSAAEPTTVWFGVSLPQSGGFVQLEPEGSAPFARLPDADLLLQPARSLPTLVLAARSSQALLGHLAMPWSLTRQIWQMCDIPQFALLQPFLLL